MPQHGRALPALTASVSHPKPGGTPGLLPSPRELDVSSGARRQAAAPSSSETKPSTALTSSLLPPQHRQDSNATRAAWGSEGKVVGLLWVPQTSGDGNSAGRAA